MGQGGGPRQCPHESLVPLRGDVSSRQRRRRTRMPRLTLSPEDSSRFLLNKDEVEEQELKDLAGSVKWAFIWFWWAFDDLF